MFTGAHVKWSKLCALRHSVPNTTVFGTSVHWRTSSLIRPFSEPVLTEAHVKWSKLCALRHSVPNTTVFGTNVHGSTCKSGLNCVLCVTASLIRPFSEPVFTGGHVRVV
ncbi:hypothetical protein J6590_060922 [Homalodisca vitripennis]|nr:hypothetical protein J6590_060922 [Homalodisca vitripennis]